MRAERARDGRWRRCGGQAPAASDPDACRRARSGSRPGRRTRGRPGPGQVVAVSRAPGAHRSGLRPESGHGLSEAAPARGRSPGPMPPRYSRRAAVRAAPLPRSAIAHRGSHTRGGARPKRGAGRSGARRPSRGWPGPARNRRSGRDQRRFPRAPDPAGPSPGPVGLPRCAIAEIRGHAGANGHRGSGSGAAGPRRR